jgi:hypothetical protein
MFLFIFLIGFFIAEFDMSIPKEFVSNFKEQKVSEKIYVSSINNFGHKLIQSIINRNKNTIFLSPLSVNIG